MDHYSRISRCYNVVSWLYSLGAVPRCRKSVLEDISENDRVCFVGVGHGEEAILAAKTGAKVTVVDLSESMLEKLRATIGELKITIHHGDVREFSGEFDVVVANFFLNVFRPHEMPLILEHLTSLASEKGTLVVGDFWDDHDGSTIKRFLQRVNWSAALSVFRLFVKMPRHAIYVYDSAAKKLGFQMQQERIFCVLGVPMYRSVIYARNEHMK